MSENELGQDELGQEHASGTGSESSAALRPHGDPLLASAQGRNDGDDGSRHGWGSAHSATDAPGTATDAGSESPLDRDAGSDA